MEKHVMNSSFGHMICHIAENKTLQRQISKESKVKL